MGDFVKGMIAAESEFSPELAKFHWKQVVHLLTVSREMDRIEETELHPQRKVLYQFSARGHDFAQIVLGLHLTHPHDGIGAYYRSRPLLLSLGLSIEDAFAAPMAKSGAFSDGRDIGVVYNFPSQGGPSVLPMAGDVGSQFTPTAGWAQAIVYYREVLEEKAYQNAIAVVFGGEGTVATNGFWSALTMASTLKLPMLFYIEDNGYAISVPGEKQTPGGNIAKNLASFANLRVREGNGSDPLATFTIINEAVAYVRLGKGPALVRLTVPRLSGHSGQDTQGYKSPEFLRQEEERDPLKYLPAFLTPSLMRKEEWKQIEKSAQQEVSKALTAALQREEPASADVRKYVFFESDAAGRGVIQQQGGLLPSGHRFPQSSTKLTPEPARTNMLTAIRRTLEVELKTNPKLLVFGEDVGPKGGVHAATMGLQETFGVGRVFDTSLSEEGIVGRAVGMALCGLMPVTEIQFRKYVDPATEQINNCGTIRWRTANKFAAPIVVRIPGGFFKCGDPWHSVSGEVIWAHAIGWQVAYPSNAEDAVGLLRAAMRSNNPTIFFEHRHCYDSSWSRRPYPGDNYLLEFGKAKLLQEGQQMTVVTWGGMVERCESALQQTGVEADLIDLRTIVPWDRDAVLASVKKTRRCLIVHEDTLQAGFGAEISAVIMEQAFLNLDAPVRRIATPDIPVPYNVALMDAVVPSVERISKAIQDLSEF